MEIHKINGILPEDTDALEAAFAASEVHGISSCNWPSEFPYAPTAGFRIFHSGAWLFIRYEVEEQYTAAKVTEDNGEVWTDSCVECFMALDHETYYNMEATCIGRILLANRKGRTEDIVAATSELTGRIIRIPSLGTEPFEERVGNNVWTLTLAVPPQALFRHDIVDWSGISARMNFYKCGDNLSRPHFLSWQPVKTEHPDFHRPEFFADVHFAL